MAKVPFKHDKDFVWRLKRVWIPANAFLSFVTAAGIGAGAPVFAESAATALAPLDLVSAGDEVATFMPVPYDLDVEKHIYFRVLWGLSGTVASADDTDFIVTYTSVNIGRSDGDGTSTAGTTTLVLPATALDTTINTANGGVQDYNTATADRVLWTGYGSIDPRTLDPLNDGLALRVEMNAQTGDPTEIAFWGLEMSYSPRYLEGPDGMHAPAKRHRTILGKAVGDPADDIR